MSPECRMTDDCLENGEVDVRWPSARLSPSLFSQQEKAIRGFRVQVSE
jgi:hypothetical protein